MPPTVVEVNKRDIVFLVDGSSALPTANFNAIREFVAKVAQRLEIGPDLIQVSVAQYADTPSTEFYFNTHASKREVVAAVRKIKPRGGSALNTGAALDFARNTLFTSGAGHRAAEGVPKLLVLITGGKSLDDVRRPARELRRDGILCFAVGSRAADQAELADMAFDASLVFTPAEFQTAPLQGMLPSLLAPLRTVSGTTEGTRGGVGGAGPRQSPGATRQRPVFRVPVGRQSMSGGGRCDNWHVCPVSAVGPELGRGGLSSHTIQLQVLRCHMRTVRLLGPSKKNSVA